MKMMEEGLTIYREKKIKNIDNIWLVDVLPIQIWLANNLNCDALE